MAFSQDDFDMEELAIKELEGEYIEPDPGPSRASDSPSPVKIVSTDDDHNFVLHEEHLERLLLNENVKDHYAVVVSVAGAFRKGKSFLLDFFLRYLKWMYDKNTFKTVDWLGTDDEPLTGFTWRGGSERVTSGIHMWSEIFTTTLASGEKVAIILLDTQGTFDSHSTVKECATVFALSTMVSSIQIYNLSQNIQEDDLQHLQLFTEYGKLAASDTGSTPFQKLVFLVRDWSFPYEANYGEINGKIILNRRLAISSDQHPELQLLRQHIKSCFSKLTCFLLPHPGLTVATSENFNGRLSDIDVEFKYHLRLMVANLLAPEKLEIKSVGGQKVRVKELLPYFKKYLEVCSGTELPEPKSMLAATAEANNLAAVAAAKDLYSNLMEKVCGGNKPYLNSERMEQVHLKTVEQVLEQFDEKKKMGGSAFSESFRDKLKTDLDEMFQQFKTSNEGKNLFKSARTPAVILVAITFCYVLSGIFSIIGIYIVANICHSMVGFGFITLATWGYIRYSGEMRELGESIDHFANELWCGIIGPCYASITSK